jgi:succinate dehydrogenase / fumarate reductase cytochrome b subunit
MWLWILHRVTGVGVLLFLLVHIIDTAFLGWGPKLYNHVMRLYTHPLFRAGEIFLFASVLYHALNGLRVILIDFWPEATRFRRELSWVVALAFLVVFVPVAYVMIHEILT